MVKCDRCGDVFEDLPNSVRYAAGTMCERPNCGGTLMKMQSWLKCPWCGNVYGDPPLYIGALCKAPKGGSTTSKRYQQCGGPLQRVHGY